MDAVKQGVWAAGILAAVLVVPGDARTDTPVYSGELIEIATESGPLVVRDVAVIARDFEFVPNPIVVGTGENVRLRVTSTDGRHGFAIRAYDINDKEIVPGREAVFEFVADKAGDHAIRCSHACGLGHLGMRATFSVR